MLNPSSHNKNTKLTCSFQTPDSSKSTLEKTKETFTGAGDKAARGAQPDHDKSTTQSVGDKFGRSKDENVHGGSGGSVVDSTYFHCIE